jgi:hypothetical protein
MRAGGRRGGLLRAPFLLAFFGALFLLAFFAVRAFAGFFAFFAAGAGLCAFAHLFAAMRRNAPVWTSAAHISPIVTGFALALAPSGCRRSAIFLTTACNLVIRDLDLDYFVLMFLPPVPVDSGINYFLYRIVSKGVNLDRQTRRPRWRDLDDHLELAQAPSRLCYDLIMYRHL